MLSRQTVSKEFYEKVRQHYSDVTPSQWRFIHYLFFPRYRDRDSHEIVVSQSTVATIEGVEPVNGYCAQHFLLAFSKEVVSVEYRRHDAHKGLARRVIKVDWPDDIHNAYMAELHDNFTGEGFSNERVYFSDGTKYSQDKQRAFRLEERDAALGQLERANCDYARRVMLYMNDQAVTRYNRVLIYYDEAKEAAAGDMQQLQILKAIRDCPQQFLHPVDGSPRLFPTMEGLGTIRKELRHILTKDWIEFDLRSCQLAIVARLWNIQEINTFLRSGESVWAELMRAFGDVPEDHYEAVKKYIKKGLYAVIFGMSKANVKHGNKRDSSNPELTKRLAEFGIEDGGAKFCDHWMVKLLFKHRQIEISKIKKAGGAENVFGCWLSTKDYNARQILAQLAQAVEMQLLFPIFELAEKTDDFVITLYQYDGVSIDFVERKESWIRRIKDVVKQRADVLSIVTCLE